MQASQRGELVQAEPGRRDPDSWRGSSACRLGSKSRLGRELLEQPPLGPRGPRAGTMILASANRSPGLPRGLGRPRPRSRSRRPVEVPGRDLDLGLAARGVHRRPTCPGRPPTVRAASRRRGHARRAGSAGARAMRTMRYRSPLAAPSVPRPPWPASRIRCPSVTPGGMLTSRVARAPSPDRVTVRRVPWYASSTVTSSSASWSAPRIGPQPWPARPPKKPPSRSSMSMSPPPKLNPPVPRPARDEPAAARPGHRLPRRPGPGCAARCPGPRPREPGGSPRRTRRSGAGSADRTARCRPRRCP